MKPTLRARKAASCVSPSWRDVVPATTTSPLVGLSMPAIRFRSVDLPEPEGPMSAA